MDWEFQVLQDQAREIRRDQFSSLVAIFLSQEETEAATRPNINSRALGGDGQQFVWLNLGFCLEIYLSLNPTNIAPKWPIIINPKNGFGIESLKFSLHSHMCIRYCHNDYNFDNEIGLWKLISFRWWLWRHQNKSFHEKASSFSLRWS